MKTTLLRPETREQQARKKMADFIDDVIETIDATPRKAPRRSKKITIVRREGSPAKRRRTA